MPKIQPILSLTCKKINEGIKVFILITLLLMIETPSFAVEEIQGEKLFKQNCSGCHINGGNIIRRGKTLKLSALKRNGLDNPDAIAKVAREGIGIMSGYKELLGEGGDIEVAKWVWNQAQKAWVQG